MANWEKLNAEFDRVIDNMTEADWVAWKERCDKRRADRLLRQNDVGFDEAEHLIELLDEHRT